MDDDRRDPATGALEQALTRQEGSSGETFLTTTLGLRKEARRASCALTNPTKGMNVNRISTFCAIGALAIAGGALAGCGGGSATGATTTSSATTATQSVAAKSAPSVVIATYKTPEDGTLISGANNRTLYVLTADEKSTSAHEKLSTCNGGCAAVWPPVLASGTPAVAGKANASLIGLTTRSDGTKQVTYNGLPLYYYVADTKAGQATGNHLKDGFGLWVGILASGKLAPDGSS